MKPFSGNIVSYATNLGGYIMSTESFGRYISAIDRHAQIIINQKLKYTNIKSGQYVFFHFIYHNEGITQQELSENLKIGKATTAKAIKSLLENEYIRREEDSIDKRCFRLYLTDKGREISPLLTNTFQEMGNIYAKGFNDDERGYILSILKKIFINVYTECRKSEYE